MPALRTARLLARGLVHVLAGLVTVVWHFPRLSPAQRALRVQRWAAELLWRWEIGLVIEGMPVASGPALLVANHISWLDIVVMHAARHCCFVAKSEIRHWPLVGRLATAAGTLYIERNRRRVTRRTVTHMAAALAQGEVVAVFPEGTTSEGMTVLPFHANLLQAAIDTDSPAVPVALHYRDARGERTTRVAYVGDETLVASLLRTLATPGLTAVVRVGAAQHAAGRDRRQWARALHAEVERLHGEAPKTPKM